VEQLVFYLFATVAIVSAVCVVAQRTAVYSAIALILCFGSVAVLFFQLGAHFIAAIQVIVYAGAIMVLFLFVVMLIDPESEVFTLNRAKSASIVALPLAGFFVLLILRSLPELADLTEQGGGRMDLAPKGSVEVIGQSLFRDYLLPFEVTSILILVAVLGAMVLAKRSN
jgi:NADH-quinone oxidoreductase subunit J